MPGAEMSASSKHFEVEVDEFCQKVLSCRMADGLLDRGELHGDIKEFHPKPGRESGLLAGFPCQAGFFPFARGRRPW